MDTVMEESLNDTGLCSDLPQHRYRNSCILTADERGLSDGIAMIRMIMSLLGFLGALSIILSAAVRKKICSSEVHPIFVLSVADFLISILWIAGASLWLTDADYNRVYCYPITLLTGVMACTYFHNLQCITIIVTLITSQILECVAVNLTLVYAVLAYIRTTKTELRTLLGSTVQKPADLNNKTLAAVYLIAWIVPVIIILPVFTIIAQVTHFTSYTQACSCWCKPTVINVLPFAQFTDRDSIKFMQKQIRYIAYASLVISIQYIVVFASLLVFYVKILLHIRRFRREYEAHQSLAVSNYGTAAVLARGQSQARTRVILFLTVFVVTGFFNLCATLFLASVTGVKFTGLRGGLKLVYYIFIYAQSITLPLQGFLNAIVYGWTRDDFISVISIPLSHDSTEKDAPANDPEGFERSFNETLDSQSSLILGTDVQ